MNQVFNDRNGMHQDMQRQQSQMTQDMQRAQSPIGQGIQNQQSGIPQMGQGMAPQGAQMGQSMQTPRIQKPQNQMPPQTQTPENGENFKNMSAKPQERNGAGFWIRLAAYVIDSIILGAGLLVVNVPLWFMELSMGDHAIFNNILFEYNIFDIIKYLLVCAYFIGMTYTTERTVGKMLMKIRVKSEVSEKMTFGQVVFRETVGKYLSGLFYVGYIMIGISDKKKGLHDQLADTKVVYEVN